MASYHLTAKIGQKGKAAPHASYISREGKYQGRERYEDLEATGHGNMPKWAEHSPVNFWEAADEYERANGSAYREIEVALPRELTPDQRRDLVEDFVRRELGGEHVYQWAIHTPKAALEKGEQPHAHIMYSERRLDGIERDPDQFFKRYNAKNPEKGGAQKASGGKARGELKQELLQLRERWADVQNIHLQLNGHDVRVDHRSLADQGISRGPEKHLGGEGVRMLSQLEAASLLERRAAEVEHDQVQRDLSHLVNVSGDLVAAKAQKQAIEASQASVETHYVQALENVTNETLATVPGLLPLKAVENALVQVYNEEKAKVDPLHDVDVAAVRNLVIEQPAHQGRLAQAEHLEGEAQATLQDIAGMGPIKRRLLNVKGMTENAEQLQGQAKQMRAQVEEAVEYSPEVRQAKQTNEQNELARRRFRAANDELNTALGRVRDDKSIWQQPKGLYRLPELLDRVVEKARTWAAKMVKGMQPAAIEQMTAKAVDVAWKAPEGQHALGQLQSRFVLPADRRQQQLAKGPERDNSPGLG